MTTVTVLSGPERRRRWAAAEKLRIVAESLTGEVSVAELARRHDVHPNLVHAWRKQARSGALSQAGDDVARFAPAVVTESARSSEGIGSAIEVILRNGRVLRLSDGVAPGRAALLADALEGCVR